MKSDISGKLLEAYRAALTEYCIGKIGQKSGFEFLKTAADVFELLRTDPLDTYAVQSSYVAEAISCAQQFIHAVYHNLEPGYEKVTFNPEHLKQWELDCNYPDWAATQLIMAYPANFITSEVRQRKTSLFKTFENDLNQTRLNADSVQIALQKYLQSFEQICNLDVISCYMNGVKPADATYCFVGRQRIPPYQYYVRKVRVELLKSSRAINPAAWEEWRAVDVPAANGVLDIRPLIWNGRLCMVWAEWRDKVVGKTAEDFVPHKLEINLAFMTEDGQWSAPLNLHSSQPDVVTRPAPVRLIATLWTDHQHPKGKLGVLLTGTALTAPESSGEPSPQPFDRHAVLDVLMRPVTDDSGLWLYAARDSRFLTAETVQHPLASQVKIFSEDDPKGTLTPYLDLNVMALRVGANDVLTVGGVCRPTGLTGTATMTLKLDNGNASDPAPLSSDKPVAGGWVMDFTEKFTRTAGSWPDPTTFSFGSSTPAHGTKKFHLKIADLMDFVPPTLLKNSLDAAQFLDLNQGAALDLRYVRLNSLFGPELVQRANHSVEAIMDWQTQHLAEPGPTGIDFEERNGAFDGANGLFFWELFFHVPHLVATRLRDEDRFNDAQNWLHYLFAPQAPADADQSVPGAKPAYWRCRPLLDKSDSGYESLAPLDPDAIAYSNPEHYRMVVFTDYVRNLLAWGDWYYRQLTRDSLAAAKLRYVQAGFLMGKPPSGSTVSRWETVTVKDLLAQCSLRRDLEKFEREFDVNLADIPAGSDSAPRLGMLACGPFKLPINEQLLNLIELPQQRLYNLRNNLTLDGRSMDVLLFSPPTDPNQLLRDLAAGGNARPRPMGGRVPVNAFYWRVAFELALRAVQTLQDFGSQILNLMERRDRAEQEELQQSHLVELGTYAQTVQEQSIAQLVASVAALVQSRLVAQERAAEYARRHDENVSAIEYEVMADLQASKEYALQSNVLSTVSATIAALPKIFGVANGGALPEAAATAGAQVKNIQSMVAQMNADKKATTEGYRRRRNDWALQRDQALAEMRAIDEQIVAQNHAVTSARTNLAQTLRANSQALTMYNFLKKRATNAELFGWMLGQLKALHYQTYDAVINLCLSAQASLNAETGDYDTAAPLLPAWDGQHYGLTVAENLHKQLLHLDREYLQRTERRLELVKTISLRRLFNDVTDPQPGIYSWEGALTQLRTEGTLEFSLSQLLFDRDYPGHYCRQISSVAVTLPVVTGPFENTRAILLQVSNLTATRATTQSVQFMYDPSGGIAPDGVVADVRSGQQVAVSLGISDDGMTAMKPEEGLLRPFQFTGAVCTFVLSFPWHLRALQCDQLQSLTDIVIELRYTARDGGAAFASKVNDLVLAEEENARNVMGKGVHDNA